MQPSFGWTFYFLGLVWFLQADKVHAIFPQTTVFVRIFLQICSDDNECMDDDNKRVRMIANLCYLVLYTMCNTSWTNY